MYEKVPDELKRIPNWVCWRLEKTSNGKNTKKPIDAKTGNYAQSNNRETWSDYETAVREGPKYSGIGFMLADGIMGIDIDDISSELERYQKGDYDTNIVFEFIETFKSYAEVSVSGNGIHIICKGSIPGARRRKGNVEMYSETRFLTVSGNGIGNYEEVTAINEKNMDRIYRKYLENNVIPFNAGGSFGQTIDLTESEIISSIMRSKQSYKFQEFMNGGWEKTYTSQSEADLAFSNLLAFWCGRDYVKMDSIFRQSSLIRGKWDERHGQVTYGEATLNKAINETTNVYTPKREPLKYDLSFMEKKKEAKTFPARSWDDTGNAQRFVDFFGELARYSYIDRKWYFYNGSYWEVDFKGNVRNLVDAVVEMMASEKISVAEGLDPEEIEKEFRKHVKRSRSNTGKKAMLDELQHRLPVLPHEFDREGMLLNAKNGYLDLTSGVLKEHDVKKMFSHESNAEYTDNIDAPEWERFLKDIFDNDSELIEYIQKAVGYSLTASTREQVMFILHGKGRNGKSIFLETLSDIMGSYASTMQASSIMVKQNNGINTDIARLKSSRFVTSSEPNEGFRFDEGLIKQLTGGDKVTARKLYGEEFEFNPEFKLWLATNHKPIIRGTDDGIWRRMILIPFTVQIPDHRVDKMLKYKLQREAAGILNWCVQGCLKWQREGLKAPSKILDASKEYRNEMDVLENFIDDCCLKGDGFQAPAAELFQTYKKWAEENSEYSMPKQKFGQQMKMKHEYVKNRDGRFYLGLRIHTIEDVRMNWARV